MSGSDRIRYWLLAFVKGVPLGALPIIVGNYYPLRFFQTGTGLYKYVCKTVIFVQMASGRPPTTLEDFCKQFRTSFFHLKLKCIFCKFDLTLTELASFHEKGLRLVWRDRCCYACCWNCINVSARYELENYTACTVKSEYLEALLGAELNRIYVRCYKCYKRLDLAEKVDIKARDDSFLLVRGTWRGTCRECSKKQRYHDW